MICHQEREDHSPPSLCPVTHNKERRGEETRGEGEGEDDGEDKEEGEEDEEEEERRQEKMEKTWKMKGREGKGEERER